MDITYIANKYVNSHIQQSTVEYKNNKTTVNSRTYKDEINDVLQKHNVTIEGAAELISELLDDAKSKKYFAILVENHGPEEMLRHAYYVKEIASRKQIHNKGKYFLVVLMKQGYQTKFKGTKPEGK